MRDVHVAIDISPLIPRLAITDGAYCAAQQVAVCGTVDSVARRVVEAEEIEELADLVIELRGVPHSHVPVQCIPVPPTLARAADVPLLYEIGHDALRRPLGDAHDAGDVTKPRFRVALDAEQHLRVTCKEMPLLGFRT